MESYSKAECEEFFINAREFIVLQNIWKEMINLQPNTPMQVESSTCDKITNSKIQQNSPRQWECSFIGWKIEWNKNTLTYFEKLEWETLGIILLNITLLHITKEWYQYIYTFIMAYRLLKGCVILSVPPTEHKVNLCLQEAIIIHNPNPKNVQDTYQVRAGCEPIPE